MEESILGAPTGVGVAIEPGRKTDPSQRTSRRAPRLDRPDLLAKREAAQSVQAPERKHPTKAPSRTAGLSGGETRSQAVQPARRPEVARREPVVVLRPEPMAPPGHRICPSSPHGHGLVHQTIPVTMCEQRQCGSYHKCSSCVHRTRPQWSGRELSQLDNSPSAHARDRLSTR